MALMFERIFDPPVLLTLAGIGLLGLIVGMLFPAVKPEGFVSGLLRGVESLILAIVGGLLARTFVSILLGLAGDSAGARLAVGWAFFLWPGAIDTIPTLLGKPLFSAGAYLWMATVIGGLVGMMDGLWRIHAWDGTGWVAFPADVTWGLAGSTNGVLFHLFDLLVTRHAYGPGEERAGAHRYQGGFRFKPTYAVTQGAVMSNMKVTYPSGAVVDYHPATPLFRHERIHVMQNRIFGPLFTLTYLGWMCLWFVPGIIMGAASSTYAVGDGIMWAAYYNNPWEAWAYKYGGTRDATHGFCFSDAVEILLGVLLAVVATALALLVVFKVWV
jgi:hypothetical protein